MNEYDSIILLHDRITSEGNINLQSKIDPSYIPCICFSCYYTEIKIKTDRLLL